MQEFQTATQKDGEKATDFFNRILELGMETEKPLPDRHYLHVLKTGLSDRVYRTALSDVTTVSEAKAKVKAIQSLDDTCTRPPAAPDPRFVDN